MHTFLIVGKNFSGLRNKILSGGDEYYLLQDILATKKPTARLKRRVLANFSSKQELLNMAEQFRGKVDGVICMYENYILPTAWIAEAFGLPGISPTVAEACTDKYLMRQLFAKAQTKISPEFTEIHNKKELLDFAANHDYPLMIKPTNLAKSLLITKNKNEVELLNNYEKTVSQIESVYKKYAPNRKPKLIVEEFIDGPVFSVDAFVDSSGNPNVLKQIVDYQTGHDIGYDDNFHYSRIIPSRLSASDQQKIRECAAIGIKSLGMKNCPAHVEIIMTKEGPMIVEIGARNGGYRERMHKLANGIDVMGITLDLALGKKPNSEATKNDSCAVLELFPKKSGLFDKLLYESEVHNLPSLVYLSIKAKPGQQIGKSSEGHKASAIIMLHNVDEKQFKKDLDFVTSHAAVILK